MKARSNRFVWLLCGAFVVMTPLVSWAEVAQLVVNPVKWLQCRVVPNNPRGLLITDVIPGGPADRAGLEVDDVIRHACYKKDRGWSRWYRTDTRTQLFTVIQRARANRGKIYLSVWDHRTGRKHGVLVRVRR